MAKIKLPDNQELEYPDEIAKDDETLRNALAPYVPDIRNAELKRSTKEGVLTVQVVKKAGTKGNEALASLLSAPEHLNPAVVMHQRLSEEKPPIAQLMLMKPEIDKSIKAARDEANEVARAGQCLSDCEPIASSAVPCGF